MWMEMPNSLMPCIHVSYGAQEAGACLLMGLKGPISFLHSGIIRKCIISTENAIRSAIAENQCQRPMVSRQRLVLVALGLKDLTQLKICSRGFPVDFGCFEEILFRRCEIAELQPLNGNLEDYLQMKFKHISSLFQFLEHPCHLLSLCRLAAPIHDAPARHPKGSFRRDHTAAGGAGQLQRKRKVDSFIENESVPSGRAGDEL